MQLTSEQAHAVELFRTSQSLKISAFAGTGKTSTLSAVARSSTEQGLYLAFNKSIADEARSKFPRSVDCRTTHSLAMRAVPDAFRSNNQKLTGPLQGNFVARLLGIQELSVGGVTLPPRSLGYLTAKTVQRFCQSGDDEVHSLHVPLSGRLSRIDVEYQDQFKVYLSQLAAYLWDRMTDPSDEAPLGHDGYLKLWSLSRPALNYDFLLLDEAQDTNEAVLSVLRRQDCHLTLVGDRHQQIYAWRGATNAMAKVDTDAEAVLTQSFRFGDAVASAATSILKVLGESNQLIGSPHRRSRIAAEGQTRTTLCRTNVGVVSVVVEALSNGRRPHVVGGVVELIRTLEDVGRLKRSIPAECPEFFGFENWDAVVEFADSDEGESLRSFVNIVNAFGATALIERLKSVERDESSADLVISTGHKSKGREWDSVTLHSDFEPRVDKTDPRKSVLNQEEARLLYVATTRAKELLVVPPRLAAKWGVPAARPSPPAVAPPAQKSPPLQPKKAPPELPSFVKVVPSAADRVKASDHPTPPPSSRPYVATPVQPSTHASEEPMVKRSTATATGIVAALVGLLFG
jgi:hypothetical protein